MPRTYDYDFAVVGAGPAGSSAARYLAKNGASVVLFERQQMPRKKPCGGALSSRAIRYLGFPLPGFLVDAQAYGARVHFEKASVKATFDEPIAVLVTRSRFDQFLLEKAVESGAHVSWEEVLSIVPERDQLALVAKGRQITAKCAIVCEGAGGKLSQGIARADEFGEQCFCVQADVPVGEPDPYSDSRAVIDLYFGVVPYGYGWVFHHGSYCSVGVGGPRSRFAAPMEVFRAFAEERGFRLADMRAQGHFIPRGGIRRAIYGDRILLAGDAAGFVDAFYGEGMAYAIRSGQLAAQAALDAQERENFSSAQLSAYEARCEEEFGSNLRHSLAVTRIMYGWPHVFLRALASDKRMLEKALLVAAGKSSYSQYLRWLAWRAPWLWLRGGLGPLSRRDLREESEGAHGNRGKPQGAHGKAGQGEARA